MKRALLLALSIVFLFSFVLAGCNIKTIENPTVTVKSEATKAPETTKVPKETKVPDATKTVEATTGVVGYKESPYFAGKGLPPVKARLPKEPKITNEMPEDMLTYEIGNYGGTLHTVTSVYDYDPDIFIGCNEPLLNSPGILGKEITGNILKGYEVSTDQKEYTFHMREGLKWSDGTPVTAKDVQFTVEDVLFNKELTPIFPGWLCSGGDVAGTPLKFTMVDDFTFKFTFDKPYGGLPVRMAVQSWRGYTELLKPAAYLKPFHKKYADPVALEAKIASARFQPGEWVNLFNVKDILDIELTSSQSIGFPRLYPWLYIKETQSTAEFERNPYYFKVDSVGNQLPYIDKIVSAYVKDIEAFTMDSAYIVKTVSGEVDFSREHTALNKMPIYKGYEAKGDYKVYLNDQYITPTDVYLNLTYKDDNWRKVVQDERFRKALNLSINRKEIIDTVYFGLAEPSTIEDTTYDVVAANKLLDEMGMTKGADGFRIGPDGKKFTIPFQVTILPPDLVPVAEVIVEQWKETLGLDVTLKTINLALWITRNADNELQASVMFTNTPLWYTGDWGQGLWGPLWNTYFNTAGKQGEKPPADVQNLYELCSKISTDKPKDAMAAADAIKSELKAHNWYFIPISNTKQPIIVNTKIGNISDKGFAIAVGFSMEQFFFKK